MTGLTTRYQVNLRKITRRIKMDEFIKWSERFTEGNGTLQSFLEELFFEGAVTADDVQCWLEEAFKAGHTQGVDDTFVEGPEM
jgi:hypothetical protein